MQAKTPFQPPAANHGQNQIQDGTPSLYLFRVHANAIVQTIKRAQVAQQVHASQANLPLFALIVEGTSRTTKVQRDTLEKLAVEPRYYAGYLAHMLAVSAYSPALTILPSILAYTREPRA